MNQYKTNNIIIQYGGFVFKVIIIIMCAATSICLSCVSSNWPADLDTFLGGTFKSLKWNPFGDILKKMGIDFSKIFKI